MANTNDGTRRGHACFRFRFGNMAITATQMENKFDRRARGEASIASSLFASQYQVQLSFFCWCLHLDWAIGPSSLSVIPEFVFRRVLVKGRWDHAHTMLLSPRVREGVHGFHVITPLIRDNGSTILVDRGFVSREFADSIPEPEENEVEVLGMLRMSQKRNFFTPDNKPDEGEWYWTDVEKMAEYAGGEKAGVQPVLLEEFFG